MTIGIATRLAVERESQRSFFGTSEGEKWLDDALKVAGVTSIPSVNNLEVKPSCWFILVDSTLALHTREKIFKTFVQSASVPICLVLTDGWSHSSQALNSVEQATKCELQVRLDYDDMLHRSFLKVMIEESSSLKGDKCLISPSNGICRELYPQRFARIRKKMSPFLALHRKGISRELSIFSFDHDQWPHRFVHELQAMPLWIQTITGKNITNRFGRGWQVEQVRHLKRLNLKPWTGESLDLVTSTRFPGLRNCAELLREYVSHLRRAVRRSFK